jgi:hypothetical protein
LAPFSKVIKNATALEKRTRPPQSREPAGTGTPIISAARRFEYDRPTLSASIFAVCSIQLGIPAPALTNARIEHSARGAFDERHNDSDRTDWIAKNVLFPKPNDPPSCLLKLRSCASITLDVLADLRRPIWTIVAPGQSYQARAEIPAVPKISITEYRHALAREQDIRPPRNTHRPKPVAESIGP